jgi:hypothetical protein
MSARTALRWLTILAISLSAIGFVLKVVDPDVPAAPLELFVVGFVGVLALFWKGEQS